MITTCVLPILATTRPDAPTPRFLALAETLALTPHAVLYSGANTPRSAVTIAMCVLLILVIPLTDANTKSCLAQPTLHALTLLALLLEDAKLSTSPATAIFASTTMGHS
jgi:hypothetical protein